LDSSLTIYVLRRILQIPPLLLGISLLAFLIFYLSPVDPVVAYLGLTTVQKMPLEDVVKVEEQLGLDKPAHERYLLWLEHIVQGDWGFSYIKKRPVLDVILERFPATLLLTLTGYGLSMVLGVIMGLASAKEKGRHWIDLCIVSTTSSTRLLHSSWLSWPCWSSRSGWGGCPHRAWSLSMNQSPSGPIALTGSDISYFLRLCWRSATWLFFTPTSGPAYWRL